MPVGDDRTSDATATSLAVVLAASLCSVVAVVLLVLLRFSDPSQNGPGSVVLILAGCCCAVGLVAIFPADVGVALGESRGELEDDTFGPLLRKLYRVIASLGSARALLPRLPGLISSVPPRPQVLYWGAIAINFLLLPSMEFVLRSGGYGLAAKLQDAASQVGRLVVGLALVSGTATVIFIAVEDDWDGELLR